MVFYCVHYFAINSPFESIKPKTLLKYEAFSIKSGDIPLNLGTLNISQNWQVYL